MRARGHSPNSLGFVSSPSTGMPIALHQSSLRKALLDIGAAIACWLLKPNFPFTCSTAVSGLQLICPYSTRKTASKPFLVLHLSIWKSSIEGCKEVVQGKKADPSFSPLTTCALPGWAFLSYGMSVMLKFHQFEVLIWKHMNGVNRRKQKKKLDNGLLSQLVKILPFLCTSVPWKWSGTYFLSHSNTWRNQVLRNVFSFLLNSYTYQNNLIHRFLPNVASILIQSC